MTMTEHTLPTVSNFLQSAHVLTYLFLKKLVVVVACQILKVFIAEDRICLWSGKPLLRFFRFYSSIWCFASSKAN